MKTSSKLPIPKRVCTAIFGLALACLLAGALLTCAAPRPKAQPAPPAAVQPAQTMTQADVQLLDRSLYDVITLVERYDNIACQTRNTIVRRLRMVENALVAGRYTAAASLLDIWMRKYAKMQKAGLLPPELAGVLQERLGAIRPLIRSGWSARPGTTHPWPPLPTCPWDIGSLSTRPGAVGEYEVLDSGDLETIISGIVMEIPEVGHLLHVLVGVFWPENEGPDIYSLIDERIDAMVRGIVSNDLQGLDNVLQDVLEYEETCITACPEMITDAWTTAKLMFDQKLPDFQWNTGDDDYRVMLLPLYAQYVNLYIALLREGVINGAEWRWNQVQIDDAENHLKSLISDATAYVQEVYDLGWAELPSGSQQQTWTEQNAYSRDMILNVLDFRDMWPYLDPIAYPEGNPDYKATRMIYSDPMGYAAWNGNIVSAPDNVTTPLYQVRAWTKNMEDYGCNGPAYLVLDAIQAIYDGSTGPIFGPVTGDYNLTGSPAESMTPVLTAPYGPYGPVIAVEGRTVAWKNSSTADYVYMLEGVTFWYNSGFSQGFGGYELDDIRTCFSATDHILANFKIMGTYSWGDNYYSCHRKLKGQYSADCIVFGFRRDDSF